MSMCCSVVSTDIPQNLPILSHMLCNKAIPGVQFVMMLSVIPNLCVQLSYQAKYLSEICESLMLKYPSVVNISYSTGTVFSFKSNISCKYKQQDFAIEELTTCMKKGSMISNISNCSCQLFPSYHPKIMSPQLCNKPIIFQLPTFFFLNLSANILYKSCSLN